MKNRVSFIIAISLCIGFSSKAQLYFADNFDNTGGTTTDLNTDLAVRQSGSYVTANSTVNWVDGSAGSASRLDYQNRLQQLQTDLQSNQTNTARVYAYLDQDFATDLTGAHYRASFDLGMELFTSGGVPDTSTPSTATAYRFLLNSSTAGASSGSAGDWDAGVSFSPYYDGSAWQVRTTYFIDGATTTFGDIAFTPVADGSEWQVPTQTVDFEVDEVANTLSVSFGSTSILSSVSLGSALGSGRYFGFASVIGSSAPSTSVLQHEVDNFSVTVVPEPGFAALAVGLMAVGLLLRRRGRKS